MFTSPSTTELMNWTWADFEPRYQQLEKAELNSANLAEWIESWSNTRSCLLEMQNRLYVANTTNTADAEIEAKFKAYLDEIYPKAMAAEQILKEKLLASGLEPAGFEIPLRNMRADADLFRTENLPLLAQEQKLIMEHDKISGAQMVIWEGEERTIDQMIPMRMNPDRTVREKAWRLVAERVLADRATLNDLWHTFFDLRTQIAGNTGMECYRDYRWKSYMRFDYTPADCRSFHKAIEAVVVPAASRIYARRKARLGVDSLRPWDLDVDPLSRQPLHPYQDVDTFIAKTAAIFHKVDPVLGGHFDVMRKEGLLDLESRKNKAHGGYCTDYSLVRLPFIFMNAVGLHDNVQTLLHEGGHAFHVFESRGLPYVQQCDVTMEIAEVASMAMELLAAPYLTTDQGGFYTPAEAARARIEHLEGNILFWPYMAVVDAFQHWAYENPAKAVIPAECDAVWKDLTLRFMPGIDWSGLEDVLATGWQRKAHIYQVPFYYVEYGLAELGAVQIWRNALKDQAGAVASYRRALALGGTRPLPQLYEAAGARLAFDEKTLNEAVTLMETTILELEKMQ